MAPHASELRAAFKAMHHRDGAFVLPNPWDAGSAQVLAARGAQALATTSAGFAFTRGAPDGGSLPLEDAIAHASALSAATGLPITADLENGGGEAPEDAAAAVSAAVEAGLAGCSLEDIDFATGHAAAYPFDQAVARVKAAVSASQSARAEGFQLTARADGMMAGVYDLDEAVRRLRAFEDAGADVLYAPAPPGPDALKRICSSVTRPVNALAAGPFLELSLRDFASLGARRVSIGSSLARLTHHAIDSVAAAMLDHGDFSGMIGGAAGEHVDALLKKGAAGAD